MRKRSASYFVSVSLYLPVLLVVAATGFFSLTASANNLVQTDRYTLTRLGPTQQQLSPMNAMVNIRFSPRVGNIEQALYELLDGSGLKLVHPESEEQYPVPVDSILMRQPLPGMHSELGPMTLREALSTLGGSAWHLRYNELGRQVWFELNDHYRDEHRLQQLLASADPLESVRSYKSMREAGEDSAGTDVSFEADTGAGSQTYLWFPPGRAEFKSLDDKSRATLTEWLASIDKRDQLILTGESQSTATYAKEALARKRAESIAQYLQEQGIPDDRITIGARHQNQASEDRQGVYLQTKSLKPKQQDHEASPKTPIEKPLKTRQDTNEFTAYDSNHPAVLGELSADDFLSVMEGETLASVMSRLLAMTDFSRLVLDITQVDLESLRSPKQSHVNSGLSIYDDVIALYAEQLPELGIYFARDGKDWALVVSDRVYPRWMPLLAFDVKRGSIQSNLDALLPQLNWALSRWEAPDYRVKERYPVVVPVRDARAATTRILSEYPLQARLNPNTQDVVVVPRTQPRRK